MRITKLKEYLEEIFNELEIDYQSINADFLGDEIGNFSLDKIPTESVIEKDITGGALYRDIFSLRSRNIYSSDYMKNLESIGFFEKFENLIELKNEEGILPDIEGIESIECLSAGALENVDPSQKTSIFEIEIRITYYK